MVAIFGNFHELFIINLQYLKLQEIVVNIWNRVIVQTFKTRLRINLNFVIHRKLIIFNQNDMKLLNIKTYPWRETQFILDFKFLVNNQVFILIWDQYHCQEDFTRNKNDTYCDLLTPSFWMNFPSSVIHKPKNGLSRS